jgi:hypothetical protein
VTTKVIQVVTEAACHYQDVTIPHNKLYCQRHGYEHQVVNRRLSDRSPHWDKVLALKQAIGTADRLMVLDADAVFMRMDNPIENFVTGPGSERDMWVCQDDGDPRHNHINSGAIILQSRDNPYWQAVCDRWWYLGGVFGREHDYFWDQTGLVVMLVVGDMGLQNRVHIADSCAFNGRNWWNPKTGKGHIDGNVLHWMGSASNPSERKDVLTKACAASLARDAVVATRNGSR